MVAPGGVLRSIAVQLGIPETSRPRLTVWGYLPGSLAFFYPLQPARLCGACRYELVLRGLLGAVNDQHLHRSLSGFQLQSKLLLDRVVNRRAPRIGALYFAIL